jgi:hypothetical protein
MQDTSWQERRTERHPPPSAVAILNHATDRLNWLSEHGKARSAEAAILSRIVDVGADAVEEGILTELRGYHDPPRFAWPDRPAPFENNAAT